MFHTYILESLQDGSYYIGHTSNLEYRIFQHNQGKSTYTKRKLPWKLVYQELFSTRSEAIRREKYLKSLKSRKRFLK